MQVGISDEERDALVAFLRERLEKERLPRSSQLRLLKRFLSKIEPMPISSMSSELERDGKRSAYT
jgi:hypothetical protein